MHAFGVSFGAEKHALVLFGLTLAAACSTDPIVVIEEPFEHVHEETPPENLIVFVGRRIAVEEFEPEVEDGYVLMDLAFLARYEVLSVVRGQYPDRVIEFEAYDHYGYPPFATYQTSLLFVSRNDDGTLYHQKYQYFPVYETSIGRWFGCGNPYRFEPDRHHGDLQAQDIEFDPPVTFSLKGLSGREIRERYPLKYFRRSRTVATCVKGNDVENLVRVKLRGVLRARGIGDT